VQKSREDCAANIEEVDKAPKKNPRHKHQTKRHRCWRAAAGLLPAGPVLFSRGDAPAGNGVTPRCTGGPTGRQRCDPPVDVSPGTLRPRRSRPPGRSSTGARPRGGGCILLILGAGNKVVDRAANTKVVVVVHRFFAGDGVLAAGLREVWQRATGPRVGITMTAPRVPGSFPAAHDDRLVGGERRSVPVTVGPPRGAPDYPSTTKGGDP